MGRVELLERDAEVAALRGAVVATAESRGSLVLLAGEAGIGKSTLVRLLRGEVRGRMPTAVVGCEPLSVPEPLGPFRDLAPHFEGLDEPLASGDAPRVARALAAACATPTLIAIEDAHWADALTLDAVRLLARRIEDLPLVLVVTYRDDELGPAHQLRTMAGDLAAAATTIRIAPARLSQAAVAALAAPARRRPGPDLALTLGESVPRRRAARRGRRPGAREPFARRRWRGPARLAPTRAGARRRGR